MAIDWTKIPIVQKDMYDTWERFSVGNQNAAAANAAKYTNPSVASDCVYAYDAVNGRVYNTINTTTLVGLVCPDKRDTNFIFDGTLNAFGGSDNDPLGIVIAYVKLPNGDTHTLTVMRTMFGQTGPNRESTFWLRSPMTVVKDYMTHAPHLVAESFGVLKFYNGLIVTEKNPWVPTGEFNPNNSWAGIAPKGVHMRVVREGDIITVESSQLNETALVPESKITIDLSKDPELEIFRGRSQYGFCSVSQDRVFWTGQVDHPKLATPFWLSDVHSMYGTHGWMSDAAEPGGIWKRNPVDMKEVFDKWKRISRGCWSNPDTCRAVGYSDVAIPSDMAFYYNPADNTIGNDIDTTSMVGFLSPDAWDGYLLEVVLRSKSDWQNDPVGLILAHTTDPDGTSHTLSVHRRLWEGYQSPVTAVDVAAPMTIELDHLTVGEKILRKVYGGLDYAEGQIVTEQNRFVGQPSPWARRPWIHAPNGVKIRAQRNGDVFTIISTRYNSHEWVTGSQVSIDLNSMPELARFKKPCAYGFSCVSNDKTYWEAIFRPGGWRKAFWMSEFGKKNDYVRSIMVDFTKSSNAAGSLSANYLPAKHETTNTVLDTIVPLKHYAPADESYVFNKDCFAFGGHFTAMELITNGFDPTEGICISRPSVVDFNFMTGGSGEVGYYIFHKSKPFSRKVQLKTYIDYEMTSGRKLSFRLPQPEEDTLLVPYIKSTSAVSGITVTIRNV